MAVVLDGDEDYLVGFYGALSCGACVVPLCPDTRTEPLTYALRHSGAKVALIDAANLRYLEGQAASLPELRHVLHRGDATLAEPGHVQALELSATLAQASATVDDRSGESDLAALIYTSGTTGRPKGVMLSHRNLVANTRSIVAYLELSHTDIAGMVLPFYYVYGNSVLHTHLAVGGTIAQLGSLVFPAKVLEELARTGATGLAGVPATFSRLLSLASFDGASVRSLRYVTQAGAAMTPELLIRLRERLGDVRIFVMYGQTEAAARLSYLPPERIADKLGSAGIAIPGVTLAICDASGRELPRGEVGEVVARGDNVMLGYLDDPVATAKVLRPEGLRTGDVGFMDEEGFLFLKGRESELIKSGGHRISPLEIEEAVIKTVGVRDVAACGLPDELLGEAVACFVTGEPEITKRRVLEACFDRLPRFKMPSQVYWLEELPRGPTGKVERRRLADYVRSGAARKLL